MVGYNKFSTKLLLAKISSQYLKDFFKENSLKKMGFSAGFMAEWPRTLYGGFRRSVEKYPHRPCLLYQKKEKIIQLSYKAVLEKVDQSAEFLDQLVGYGISQNTTYFFIILI